MGNEPFIPTSAEFVGNLPAALVYVDNDEHYTLRFANQRTANMLGYDMKDFLNSEKYKAASVVHPEDLDLLEEIEKLQAETSDPLIVRYRLIDSTGKEVPVIDISQPYYDADGKLRGAITLLVDLRGAPELQGERGLLGRIS